MKLDIQKTVTVEAKCLRLHIKVCDGFAGDVCDQHDEKIGEYYEGYVPDFMPGNHYGDYLILNIDLETGQIINWKPPTKEQIEKFIRGDNE